MCDALVAVGSETADGVTRFAKSSDRKPGEAQPFVQYPAASHPPGAAVRCTHVEIPQVSETYRVMGHAPWWVWGFEHGVNEHGLAIGNLTVFSREPVEETPGLIGMDLARLALERAASARQAVEVIASLLARHGQGGPAFAPDAGGYHNAFALADPGEAWILETTGRRFAARRARADTVSNHYSIRADWELASPDLEEHARACGFWGSGRLDVAAAFRSPEVPGRISDGRRRRTRERLARARTRIDDAALCAILRDHLAAGPAWPGGRTPEEEAFFTVCAHSAPIHETTASLVAPLPPARARGDGEAGRAGSRVRPVWISFATPCTGLFLPVYLDGVIPAALAHDGLDAQQRSAAAEEANEAEEAAGGAEPGKADARDDAVTGRHTPATASAWRTFKALQDAAAADLPGYTPLLRSAWDAFGAELDRERAEVEHEAASLATRPPGGSGAGRDRACEVLTAFMSRCAERALENAERLREQIACEPALPGGDARRPGAH